MVDNKLIFLFFVAVFESLLAEKQIPGTLTDRNGNACTYVPNIYTKTLNNWVMNFYSNNNYLGIYNKYNIKLLCPINGLKLSYL